MAYVLFKVHILSLTVQSLDQFLNNLCLLIHNKFKKRNYYKIPILIILFRCSLQKVQIHKVVI